MVEGKSKTGKRTSANRNRKGKPSWKRGNGRRKKSFAATKIEHDKLVHVGTPVEETKYTPSKSYQDFPLHQKLKFSLDKLGFTHPTEIQDKSFEAISGLRNVLGIAHTGTGKTGAFLIPIINSLLTEKEPFLTLVIVPTRELAQQVEDEFRKMVKGMRFFITCLIGGQSINRDIKNLNRQNHVIVGTPGRLKDLATRGAINLNNFSVLVLDEFDRMLDMGFSKEVNFLTEQMSERDQTLLFSATVDPSQKTQIDELLIEPVEIKVSSGEKSASHIHQDIVHEQGEEKFPKLLDLMNDTTFEKVLVFAETKRNVSKVTKGLKNSGIKADEIHGDKTQAYRQKALNKFKSGDIKVLVATDVAARGLDISNVTHVINYEMPPNYETYIHRIGRTGRAGKPGNALTFVN